LAIPLVRKLVGARRRYGLSWDQSLADVAPELGISPWRAHTLYYRLAGIRPVLLAEWNRLRLSGATCAWRRCLARGGRVMASQLDRLGGDRMILALELLILWLLADALIAVLLLWR
jgi:hypothetical protein